MSNSRDANNPPQDERAIANISKQKLKIDVASGLLTGMASSGLFSPWDRALFLSVVNKRSFLTMENFKSPYHGLSQSIFQRAISGGIYYTLQSQLNAHLYPVLLHQMGASESVAQFCVGLSAGSISGVITNSISAIKYYTWSHASRSLSASIQQMHAAGGYRPFVKGTSATMARDMVFGGTYELLRKFIYAKMNETRMNKKIDEVSLKFMCNIVAASFATTLSGPLNYVRSIQYATPPEDVSPTIGTALTTVWNESKTSCQTSSDRFRFFRQRLNLLPGAARTTAGIVVGQTLFDWTQNKLTELKADKPLSQNRC